MRFRHSRNVINARRETINVIPQPQENWKHKAVEQRVEMCNEYCDKARKLLDSDTTRPFRTEHAWDQIMARVTLND